MGNRSGPGCSIRHWRAIADAPTLLVHSRNELE